MKKEEVPQDPSALINVTKEMYYAVDASGKYSTELSSGWKIKAEALGVAWQDIEQRIAEAKQKVQNGEASPILYFMELHLMDLVVLADYTGFWQWTIKRHLKPDVFKNLGEKKLQKYAEAFGISVDDLKNLKGNGS